VIKCQANDQGQSGYQAWSLNHVVDQGEESTAQFGIYQPSTIAKELSFKSE
jgi:hypothetical protein